MKTTLISLAIMLLSSVFPYGAMAQKRAKNAKSDSIAIAQRTKQIRDSLNVIMNNAKEGDADAMNEVGTWYYTGKHVKKDYAQAYEWWKKSSLKANVRAIANLGLCYQLGHGIKKDSVDAIRLYEKSIKEGNTALLKQRAENASKNAFDAMLVGDCHEKGIGVKKDLLKAAKFYTYAADNGNVDGMRHAGICYLNAKDNANALKYFEKGAKFGDHSCEYWAGKMLIDGMSVPVNKEQAVIYLLKAAEGGMPAAQNEIGTLYAEGNGVTKNLSQAVMWYSKSAMQGNVKGMWNYGNALKDGIGVDCDYDQALFWMAEAAQEGYQRTFAKMIAQMETDKSSPFLNYVYGMKLYLIDGDFKAANNQFKKVSSAKIAEGEIMQAVILASKRNEKPNAKKAAKNLEKLALSDAEAAFYLASLYESGNGVAQDMNKAISLYRTAADMGYGKAQSHLADIYYEGRGAEKDLITSVSLYQKSFANRQLSANGAMRLAECYEKGLAGLSQDKQKAEQLKAYKPSNSVNNLLRNLK